MGAISLLILYIAVPTPATKNLIREPFTVCLQTVFKEANLWKLNFGIFCLHAILTASFVAIPILLADQLHIPSQHQWYIYLGVLIVSFVLMMAFISIGERRGYYRGLQLGAIGGLVLAELLLWALPTSLFSLLICMTLFFTAFNLLEASLPSLVSKLVPMERRGMAMGVYSSCQFLGIFAGGSLAGWVFGMWKMDGVLLLAAGIGCIWLLAALWMPAVKQDNEQKLTQ
ncbi:MAG: MFS transporter [Coxiellaceae bacterium]|nr:MAG: MFS transporter [Coxiellaceae bacterium]